ncbi:hypothetical protein JCM11957_06920 [Caminibacter profundus]
MSRKKIDIAYKKTTIHPAVTELTFDVLRAIASEKQIAFTRVVEELLEESETFKKYKKNILENGFYKQY